MRIIRRGRETPSKSQKSQKPEEPQNKELVKRVDAIVSHVSIPSYTTKNYEVPIGPFDLSEFSQEDQQKFVAELNTPGSDTIHKARHLDRSWYDLPVHLWTQRMSMYIPFGCAVKEEVVSTSDTDGDSVGALHILVPGSDAHEAFTVSVSLFYAPRTCRLWHDRLGAKAFEALGGVLPETVASHTDDVSLETLSNGSAETGPYVCETLWGHGVRVTAPQQDVYAVGVDGPLWTARIIGMGRRLSQYQIAAIDDMIGSMVVHRERNVPHAPESPFDLAVIDRTRPYNVEQKILNA